MLPLLLVPLLAAGALPVREARFGWDGPRLSLAVGVDGALTLEKVNYGLNSHDQLWIGIPGGTLAPATPAFGEAGMEIRTRRQRDGLLLTLNLEESWSCRRPVTLETLPDGVRASLTCANPPAPEAPAAARPALGVKPTGAAANPEVPVALPAAVPAPAAPVAAEAAAPAAPEAAPAPAAKPADAPLFAASAPAESSGGPGWGGLAAVVLLLGLAAGAWLLARRRPRAARGIEVLESTSLGPRRSLVLARVGDEVLLLGASEGGLSLLKILTAAEAAALRPESAPPRASLARRAPPDPEFQSLLQESVEDQELRRKLQMGLGGRVP